MNLFVDELFLHHHRDQKKNWLSLSHLETLAEMSLRDLFSPPLAQISGSAWASSRLAATPLGPASVAASLASMARRDDDVDDDAPLPSARRGSVDFVAAASPPPPPAFPDHAASLLPAKTPRLTSTRPQRTRRAIALALDLLRSAAGGFFDSGLKAICIEKRLESERFDSCSVELSSHFFFSEAERGGEAILFRSFFFSLSLIPP